MTQKKTLRLTPAEWRIMRIAWEEKSRASRDFCRIAGLLYDWSPSTVKSLLRRLVEKGYLKTTQVGNSFLYEPPQPAIKALRKAADFLMENVVDGASGPLLSYMVQKSRLSPGEIEELHDLLNNHKGK